MVLAFCHGMPDTGSVPMIEKAILAPFAALYIALVLLVVVWAGVGFWRRRK